MYSPIGRPRPGHRQKVSLSRRAVSCPVGGVPGPDYKRPALEATSARHAHRLGRCGFGLDEALPHRCPSVLAAVAEREGGPLYYSKQASGKRLMWLEISDTCHASDLAQGPGTVAR